MTLQQANHRIADLEREVNLLQREKSVILAEKAKQKVGDVNVNDSISALQNQLTVATKQLSDERMNHQKTYSMYEQCHGQLRGAESERDDQAKRIVTLEKACQMLDDQNKQLKKRMTNPKTRVSKNDSSSESDTDADSSDSSSSGAKLNHRRRTRANSKHVWTLLNICDILILFLSNSPNVDGVATMRITIPKLRAAKAMANATKMRAQIRN